MADDVELSASDLSERMDELQFKTGSLVTGANSLARAMTSAFSQSASGGRQLDDVLKTMALRISNMAVSQAFRPLAGGIAGGIDKLFGGLFGGSVNGAVMPNAMGAIKPFAAGGVIGTPTYFPLSSGGLGLAGEAGPEAIMPLQRGPDGRLGVGGGSGRGATINVHIATPDTDSFRRSESYITGQIARAVARGQRSL